MSNTAEPLSESSLPVALWVMPVVGAVLLPGLWWTSADRPFAFRPDLIMTMTLFVAIFAVAVLAVLSNGFQRRIRWSLGTTGSVVIVGFQWRIFTIAGESVADTTGMALAADVIPVVLGGGLLWLTVRLAGDWQFAGLFALAMAVAVGSLGVTALSLVAPAPPPLTITAAPADAPDVVLLVLDGYGRADWLATEYGFDNGPFLDSLESRGFAIASEATPNYGYTYASVSTMLNLDYVFAPGEVSDDEQTQMRAALTGAAGLMPTFKEAGYDIAYVENQWGGSLCGSAVDSCIRERLVERSLWTLGQMTILAPLVDTVRPKAVHTVATHHLNSLARYLGEPRTEGRPRLLFAHVILPHDPLLLDAECNYRPEDEFSEWGPERGAVLEERRRNYVEQTKCVNDRVLEAIDSLIGESPGAVVMITGDHGPGSLLNPNHGIDDVPVETIEERMKTLGAYRLPGCEESFRIDLTPVNGVRTITNCALGAELPALPDRNFWTDVNATGFVTELTAAVRD